MSDPSHEAVVMLTYCALGWYTMTQHSRLRAGTTLSGSEDWIRYTVQSHCRGSLTRLFWNLIHAKLQAVSWREKCDSATIMADGCSVVFYTLKNRSQYSVTDTGATEAYKDTGRVFWVEKQGKETWLNKTWEETCE